MVAWGAWSQSPGTIKLLKLTHSFFALFLHLFGFRWDGILSMAPLELLGSPWTMAVDEVRDRDADGSLSRSPHLAARRHLCSSCLRRLLDVRRCWFRRWFRAHQRFLTIGACPIFSWEDFYRSWTWNPRGSAGAVLEYPGVCWKAVPPVYRFSGQAEKGSLIDGVGSSELKTTLMASEPPDRLDCPQSELWDLLSHLQTAKKCFR